MLKIRASCQQPIQRPWSRTNDSSRSRFTVNTLRARDIRKLAIRNNRKNTILHDSDKLFYYLASTRSQLCSLLHYSKKCILCGELAITQTPATTKGHIEKGNPTSIICDR